MAIASVASAYGSYHWGFRDGQAAAEAFHPQPFVNSLTDVPSVVEKVEELQGEIGLPWQPFFHVQFRGWLLVMTRTPNRFYMHVFEYNGVDWEYVETELYFQAPSGQPSGQQG